MEPLYEQILKLFLVVFLGGLVGLEREISHKPAGLRTHILVCLGSALVTITSIDYFAAESSRIVQGIITGIGFIGAGTIIAQGTKGIHGLTTAASLWVVAVIGISIRVGAYLLSIISTVFVVLILFIGKYKK